MFFHHDLRADQLPDRTLCLTFDDGPGETPGAGPGPQTTELGRFLHAHGIRATFFVVGRHALEHRDTLARLRDGGHLIGNHTFSHPGLADYADAGGDVIEEVARADAVIRPYQTGSVVYLRPPYGSWRRPGEPTSPVAESLNRSGRFPDYVGPIHWDISFGEWEWWRQDRSAEACAAGFLEKIEQRRRGIVLMHDSSEEEEIRVRNRTTPMVKILVPELLARGFRFVALDEIPQIRAACG